MPGSRGTQPVSHRIISAILIVSWLFKFTRTVSTYIKMDMDTRGMRVLVISVYIRYGAVQLKLFPETKIKSFEWYRSVAQFD